MFWKCSFGLGNLLKHLRTMFPSFILPVYKSAVCVCRTPSCKIHWLCISDTCLTEGWTVLENFIFTLKFIAGFYCISNIGFLLKNNRSFFVIRFIIMTAQHTIWPTDINIAQVQSKQRTTTTYVEQIPDGVASVSVPL